MAGDIVDGLSHACLDLQAVQSLFTSGQATPAALITALYPRLIASGCVFVHLASLEQLQARAKAVMQMPAHQRGPLWGVPCAVKDNVDVAGMPTTAACPAFEYTPTNSSTAVAALESAGVVIVGKTNLDQFAAGLVGTRSPYGAPTTPFDNRFISGGSSSGSGVAVAAGLVSFALGTDTAGSGRVPAGLCGCVGIKGTVGSISTVGVVPAAASLDCLTVFARSVPDAAVVMRVMRAAHAGSKDIRRRTPPKVVSSPPAVGFRFAAPALSLSDWTCRGGGAQQARAAAEQFNAAIQRLKACGGVQVEVDFTPFNVVAAMLYNTALIAERYSGLRSFLEAAGGGKTTANDERLLAVTRTIIAGAGRFSAADVFDTLAELAKFKAQAEDVLRHVDCLIVPTALAHYTTKEILAEEDVPKPQWTQNANLGRFTNFVNLLDMCGVAVPSGVLQLDADLAAQEAAKAAETGGLTRQQADDVAARAAHLKETGTTKVTLPFGVTLLAPAWQDEWLWGVGASMHRAAGLGCGPSGHGIPAPKATTVTAAAK